MVDDKSPMNRNQNDLISEAFSREAHAYDFEETRNPVISHLRNQIRSLAKGFFPEGGSILEINAGTGQDALWFAQQRYRIHATDIAEGMLASLEKNVNHFDKPNQFTFQKLSFTELDRVYHAPFDGVFSNFGGLNCIPDFSIVLHGIKKVLKPDGIIVLVFMPKVCFWEIAQIGLGRINVATRRFIKGGVQANVGGVKVDTYYFSLKQVKGWLGRDFEIMQVQSLSLFAPPMNLVGFIHRFPRLTKFLLRFDEIVGKLPFLNLCGDFLILVAKYKSQK